MREDNPLPFNEMKPLVTKLVDAQVRQCNRLAEDAKRVLTSDESDEDALDEATSKLYQVKRGMPTTGSLCGC